MYTVNNTQAGVVDGSVNNVIIPFPGALICPAATLSKGILIEQRSLIKIDVPADVANQRVHLIHYIDEDPILDSYADTEDIPTANTPFLFGLYTELFIGNDGNLYQYGRAVTADDMTEFFVFGNSNRIGLGFPMGPIATPIQISSSGAATEALPFDLDVLHTFTVRTKFTEVQPLLTATLLHSSIRVCQGNNGNTASQ